MAAPLASIQSLTLELPPSCIEFCPEHPDYFCVGTYSLVEDEARAQGDLSRPQSRHGSIVVFRLEGTAVHQIEVIAQPSATLDLHFQQVEGRRDVFAVASSTASLSVFRLAPLASTGHTVEKISEARIDGVGEDILFLSCAWHPSIADIIAVSTSSGNVFVMATGKTQRPIVVSKTAALTHDLETWTVAFSPPAWTVGSQSPPANNDEVGRTQDGLSTTMYSGSDDSLLKYTSCVLKPEAADHSEVLCAYPTGTCRLTGHNAGVTAILPTSLKSPDGGRIVVTGSYDDHVRVYSIFDPADTGGVRRATCLAEQDLGGGVWRLKLVSQTTSDGGRTWGLRILASCMHAGARVIEIGGDASGACQIAVAARFEEHKSMNYGSDFQNKNSLMCISTSFYDKLLCLWEVKDNVNTE